MAVARAIVPAALVCDLVDLVNEWVGTDAGNVHEESEYCTRVYEAGEPMHRLRGQHPCRGGTTT